MIGKAVNNEHLSQAAGKSQKSKVKGQSTSSFQKITIFGSEIVEKARIWFDLGEKICINGFFVVSLYPIS